MKEKVVTEEVKTVNEKPVRKLRVGRAAAILLVGTSIVWCSVKGCGTFQKSVNLPINEQTQENKNLYPNTFNTDNIKAIEKEAKDFASQFSANPSLEDIDTYKNLILFIHAQKVPDSFDILNGFVKPILRICNINFISARNKLVCQTALNDKRIPVSIEKLFARESDRAAVKYVGSKQQAILDAIYTHKSDSEVKEMVNNYIKMIEKMVINRENVEGIEYRNLSEEAKAVIGYVNGTIIAMAPDYPNINNISKTNSDEINECMKKVEYSFNQRRIAVEVDKSIIAYEKQKVLSRKII